MKKEKAMELFATFPPEEEWIVSEIKRNLRAYMIIGSKEAYCTYCESRLPVDKETKATMPHRENIMCPNCLESVTAIHNFHKFNGNVIEDKANFVVFQHSEATDWLYVRCYSAAVYFEQYKLVPKISLVETQRYIFDDKHCIRYGRGYELEKHQLPTGYNSRGYYTYYTRHFSDEWSMRTKFDEPVFEYKLNYGLINETAISNTCMRHCMLKESGATFVLRYLKFYQQHRGAERLIKAGLVDLIKPIYGYNYGMLGKAATDINWKETEVHKMLGVSRPIIDAIRAGKIRLDEYKRTAEHFPAASLDRLIQYNNVIKSRYGTLDVIVHLLDEKESRILKYLIKQEQRIDYYDDYLKMCLRLDEDICDRVIRYPKDLVAAHERVRSLQMAIDQEKKDAKNKERIAVLNALKERRKALEFEYGDYFVRQPESMTEIKNEGKALHHCVGGYAERHADGETSIMFIRKKSDPDTPFYTVEVELNYTIAQCFGAYNNQVRLGGEPKPESIIVFEKHYQAYLYSVARKKNKVKVSA